MSLIDELLGDRIRHVIEDGEGGHWEVSIRPRLHGTPVSRTTAVSFHRPNQRSSSGFGVQLWVLRSQATLPRQWRDPVADCSINLTQAAARNALNWIDGIERG